MSVMPAHLTEHVFGEYDCLVLSDEETKNLTLEQRLRIIEVGARVALAIEVQSLRFAINPNAD